jgi:streptogramin lyase
VRSLSLVSKWLRGGKRRAPKPAPRPRRRPAGVRLSLHPLDDRILPSVTEFGIPTPDTEPIGITRGPDGNLWFADIHAIGRITPAGVVTEFSQGLAAGSEPVEIAAGPDGNVWFTEGGTDRIGRITPAGVITEFSTPTPGGNDVSISGITAGPDGNLWFTEGAGAIGRITTAGAVTLFTGGLTSLIQPNLITAGPDGNLWFTDLSGNKIGRITPAGAVTEFPVISRSSEPFGITAGPDGNLWFTESATDRVGRITPAGVVTEFAAGITPGAIPSEIAAGPDGNLWFTEGADALGRITPAGVVTEFATGITAGSDPRGITAGPDGNVWFTEFAGNRIGRLALAAPPKVAGVVVNGGSAQRSLVTQIQVAFDQHVTLPANPADAFRLTRQGDNAAVTLSAAVDDTGPGTVVTLTFTGGAVDNASLADGRYTLTVVAAQVAGPNGALDGDGDGQAGGDFVLAGDPASNTLFRLFGDVNGDGAVNGLDFAAFRAAFGTGQPGSPFDVNGDGVIDNLDFFQFRRRFGTAV